MDKFPIIYIAKTNIVKYLHPKKDKCKKLSTEGETLHGPGTLETEPGPHTRQIEVCTALLYPTFYGCASSGGPVRAYRLAETI
jgi:hypothetical protein